VDTQARQPARIRVLLLDLPKLLHGMLREAVKAQRDMALVARRSEGDLASDVRRSGINVIIVGLKDGIAPSTLAVLADMSPGIAVIGVDQDGRRTVVELGNLSLEDLVAITRVAALAQLAGD
jgi:hypothetical protein